MTETMDERMMDVALEEAHPRLLAAKAVTVGVPDLGLDVGQDRVDDAAELALALVADEKSGDGPRANHGPSQSLTESAGAENGYPMSWRSDWTARCVARA